MPPDDRRTGRSPVNPGNRGTAGNAGSWGQGDLGEVYFEFRPVGSYMRVNAIHAETGCEIFVLGPLNTNRNDLQLLALRKLRMALSKL